MKGHILSVFIILFIVSFTMSIIEAQTKDYEHGPYLDPQILEFFEERESLRIIVELFDESGIVIEGTKEERRSQIEQIDEWFEPEVDKIVLDYASDSDIDLVKERSRGFVAIVTEEGFWRLANDSRVSAIYYDAPMYAAINDSHISEEETIPTGEVTTKVNRYEASGQDNIPTITIILLVLSIIFILIILAIKFARN